MTPTPVPDHLQEAIANLLHVQFELGVQAAVLGRRNITEKQTLLSSAALTNLVREIRVALDAAPPRQPLSERQIVACLVDAGCVGSVKMSYDSGPYEITRTSINADRFARAIERAHNIGVTP